MVLGLSTLAAAALGNAFSNSLGMVLHGTIERFANAIGLPDPRLTVSQRSAQSVKSVRMASGIVGVAVKPVAQLVERHVALCPVGAQRPTRPPGWLRGLRPLLRTPERRLRSNLDA